MPWSPLDYYKKRKKECPRVPVVFQRLTLLQGLLCAPWRVTLLQYNRPKGLHDWLQHVIVFQIAIMLLTCCKKKCYIAVVCCSKMLHCYSTCLNGFTLLS